MTKVLIARLTERYRWCDERESQELLTETEPLTLAAEVFRQWGGLGGCFFPRERG